MKKNILFISFALMLILSGCIHTQKAPEKVLVSEKTQVIWQNIEIENVNTGEKIKIKDIDAPVFLETFAVWCPTCKKQQDNIKEFHELIGEEAFSISLDVDPNEDAEAIVRHANKYGFDWFYAVSPKDLTLSLIDSFGVSVVNAPSVPVILICPDKSFIYLKKGLKSAEDLKTALDLNC